mmetsp:Transcript_23908/g.73646  ORF Transcript_23908/g.73646 Transcript_23908/m.73646 type:complete len:794 (-) Transcript_23908:2180-4561(-)
MRAFFCWIMRDLSLRSDLMAASMALSQTSSSAWSWARMVMPSGKTAVLTVNWSGSGPRSMVASEATPPTTGRHSCPFGTSSASCCGNARVTDEEERGGAYLEVAEEAALEDEEALLFLTLLLLVGFLEVLRQVEYVGVAGEVGDGGAGVVGAEDAALEGALEDEAADVDGKVGDGLVEVEAHRVVGRERGPVAGVEDVFEEAPPRIRPCQIGDIRGHGADTLLDFDLEPRHWHRLRRQVRIHDHGRLLATRRQLLIAVLLGVGGPGVGREDDGRLVLGGADDLDGGGRGLEVVDGDAARGEDEVAFVRHDEVELARADDLAHAAHVGVAVPDDDRRAEDELVLRWQHALPGRRQPLHEPQARTREGAAPPGLDRRRRVGVALPQSFGELRPRHEAAQRGLQHESAVFLEAKALGACGAARRRLHGLRGRNAPQIRLALAARAERRFHARRRLCGRACVVHDSSQRLHALDGRVGHGDECRARKAFGRRRQSLVQSRERRDDVGQVLDGRAARCPPRLLQQRHAPRTTLRQVRQRARGRRRLEQVFLGAHFALGRVDFGARRALAAVLLRRLVLDEVVVGATRDDSRGARAVVALFVGDGDVGAEGGEGGAESGGGVFHSCGDVVARLDAGVLGLGDHGRVPRFEAREPGAEVVEVVRSHGGVEVEERRARGVDLGQRRHAVFFVDPVLETFHQRPRRRLRSLQSRAGRRVGVGRKALREREGVLEARGQRVDGGLRARRAELVNGGTLIVYGLARDAERDVQFVRRSLRRLHGVRRGVGLGERRLDRFERRVR